MEASEAGKNESTTGDSTPETTQSNQHHQRKVSLSDVRRRLEAEKKRIANLRKSRSEAKATSPKNLKVAAVKRKAERLSVEVETKRRRVPTPKASAIDALNRKKHTRTPSKPVLDTEDQTEPENLEEDGASPTPDAELRRKDDDDEEDDAEDMLPLSALAADGKETGLPPDTEYFIGYRLEAKDFNGDWYPARVMEVDFDAQEVLVHFDRWSSRYDEWVEMNSPRLRPPGPLSNPNSSAKQTKSGVSKPKMPATLPPPTSSPAPTAVPAEKTTRKFQLDDPVMANWSDSRKYPATVIEVLENDLYKVRFYDGFEKIVKGNRMAPGLQTEPPPVAPAPAIVSSPYPVEEDIGSKADRRERKRKHTVTELFSLKPRSNPPKMASVANSPSKSSPANSGRSAAAGRTTAASKSVAAPSTSVKSSLTSGTAKSTEGPPPSKRSKAKPQSKLQSPGHEDLMLIKSLSGEVIKSKSRASTATSTSELRRVRTLLPRARTEDTAAVSEPPPPHNACTRALDAPPPPVSQPDSILEGMQIEMVGDNFKCPNADCGKLYRKENLLQMHIKHYHPELKSLLVVVPKVLDLAYARTVGDLPSTSVMPRASHTPATPSSTPTSTSNPSMRKNFTPQIVLKRSNKMAEKGDRAEKTEKQQVTSSDEKVIQSTSAPVTAEESPQSSVSAPLPANLSPVKTGHIKTLLPVNRSPLKSDTSKEEQLSPEKSAPAPLSALQQALMSPPGHLAAQMPRANLDNRMKSKTKQEVRPHFASSTRSSSGSPRGRAREEKSPNKELVNCMCGIPDEDGLMIQCDLCMCWQHGSCNMIETDDQVPDKYVCHICLHPNRQRQSRKYAHDQDWLKEGILPRMPIRRNQGRVVRTPIESILKESHEITATIIRLQEVIHSLRVKINIAEKADHPKLYLWSKRWNDEEEAVKVETIKSEHTGVQLETKVDDEECKEEEKIEAVETETKVEEVKTTEEEGESKIEEEESKIEEEESKIEEGEENKSCSQGSDESDLHPALKLPLSQSEIEHLASSVESNLRDAAAAEQPVAPPPPAPPVKAPEPEAAIQPAACRLVLLEHITKLQAQLEARLAQLEARADELEARDPELCEPEGGSSCTKETLRLLQRDLSSVTRISHYANSD